MSIINQMLKDLEKRKNGNNQDNLSPLGEHTPPPEPPKKHPRLVGLIILLVLVIIACSIIFYVNNKQKSAAKEILAAAKSTTIDPHSVIKQVEKTKIHSLEQIHVQYEEANDYKTQVITLGFNRPPHYNIYKNLDNREVVITFINAYSSIPDQIDDEYLIEAHDLQSEGKNLALNLFFPDNLEQVSLKYDENNIIITIKAPNSPIVEDDLETAPQEPVVTVSNEQRIEINYEEALAKAKQGKLNDAKDSLKALLDIQSDFYPAIESLALINLQQKLPTQALDILNQGLLSNPKHEPFVRLKARAQLQLDQPKEALETLHTISPELTNAPDFYSLMAAIEQRMGNHLYAAELYQQLLTNYPNNGTWWLGLAVSLQSAKQNNAALDAYQRAINTKTLKPNIMAFAKSQVIELGG